MIRTLLFSAMLWLTISLAHASVRYEYDMNNQVTGMQYPQGRVNLTYNLLNQLTNVMTSDGEAVSYDYDALGRRIAMTDNEGKTTYQWDQLNRLVAVSRDGIRLTYQYDRIGRRTRITYPNGSFVAYGYHPDGMLATVVEPFGTQHYRYDSQTGLMTAQERYNKANELVGFITYEYDPITRRVVTVNHHNADETVRLSFHYDYDGVGNVTLASTQRGAHQSYDYYEYDALNRLVFEQRGLGTFSSTTDGDAERYTYDYDAAGNLTQMTYALWVDDVKQDTSYVQTYTLDGNHLTQIERVYDNQDERLTDLTYSSDRRFIKTKTITTRRHIFRDVYSDRTETQTFEFNVLGKLTQWSNGLNKVKYTYDGAGNRLTREALGPTTHFVNDTAMSPVQSVMEFNDARQVTQFMSYGGQRLTRYDRTKSGSYSVNFFVYDRHHVSELESTSNNLTALYEYGAFGDTSVASGSMTNAYQYTGEYREKESGLIYLRNRYYDPSIQRFISEDTFDGFQDRPQSLNQFAYVENNPINYTDPFGMCVTSDTMGWVNHNGERMYVHLPTFHENYVNEYLANEVGQTLPDYLETKPEEAQKIGANVLSTMGIAVGALNPTVGLGMAGAAWFLDSSWSNFIGMVTGPVGKAGGVIDDALYFGSPVIKQTVDNVGTVNDATSIGCNTVVKCD